MSAPDDNALAATEPTQARSGGIANLTPWQPGQSGNPSGRPKGSRNKVTEAYFDDLHELWKQKGKEVLEIASATEPMKFAQMVASLMPRDINVTAQPLQEMTDEQLLAALGTIQRYLDGGAHPLRIGETIEAEATVVVPAVPEAAGVPQRGAVVPRAPADGGKPARKNAKRRG